MDLDEDDEEIPELEGGDTDDEAAAGEDEPAEAHADKTAVEEEGDGKKPAVAAAE